MSWPQRIINYLSENILIFEDISGFHSIDMLHSSYYRICLALTLELCSLQLGAWRLPRVSRLGHAEPILCDAVPVQEVLRLAGVVKISINEAK